MMCFGAKVADIAPDQSPFWLEVLIFKCRHVIVDMRVSPISLITDAPFWSRLISVRRRSSSPNERTNVGCSFFSKFILRVCVVLRRSSTELPFIHLCSAASAAY